MLALLMPLEVRRSLICLPESVLQARTFWALCDPYAVETARPRKTHRLRPDPASRLQGTVPKTGQARKSRDSMWNHRPASGTGRSHVDLNASDYTAPVRFYETVLSCFPREE